MSAFKISWHLGPQGLQDSQGPRKQAPGGDIPSFAGKDPKNPFYKPMNPRDVGAYLWAWIPVGKGSLFSVSTPLLSVAVSVAGVQAVHKISFPGGKCFV